MWVCWRPQHFYIMLRGRSRFNMYTLLVFKNVCLVHMSYSQQKESELPELMCVTNVVLLLHKSLHSQTHRAYNSSQ